MRHFLRPAMLLGSLIVLSLSTVGASAAPFGNPEDISFGQKLWRTLENNRLVGKDTFRPMPYETAPPHGNIVETLDGMIDLDNRRSIVIVKKNFGKRDVTTLEQVADNPEKYMTSITVMFKREKGYDTENKDWFWAKFQPDGTLMKNKKGMSLAGRVAKGSDKACIACHSAAPGDDYVYIHDRYAQ